MIDTRELILSRLETIFGTITPTVNVFRNRLRIPDELLPAVSVLDGDEVPDDGGYGRNRPANAPIIVTMRPEIYAFAAGTKDKNIGQDLNTLRLAIMGAILNDAELLALCHNGDVRYEGFSTGLANGRSLEGELAIGFAFIYVLRPAALVSTSSS